ncbi:DUF2507 domain-containing protein [Thermicanus aegyptius]|uniref:DUF2507 domain-containing protein n=1 Tax=Thermicanus aegyptius TaxID=94009 RepID=UPI0004235F61|nr:DUF2507 domain-containing protein [Thermicanus aegyptius]
MSKSLIWFRTEVVPLFLEEYENSLLYWIGKEMAERERLKDFISLRHYFEKNGLGKLSIKKREKDHILLLLHDSPLSSASAASVGTLSLECGMVTYAMEELFQQKGEGSVHWTDPQSNSPSLEIKVAFLK